ncbi:hypothetical protein PAAG_11755 [Paracoccidioides lutzii Pb01]|uniref:Uncharacterized protein n=1 Tax=Paracoccidioides lutzii (strain ATCC MYA-826 / Pb01) TaxID=502779 RepID=A0A0A2V1Z0_PARBA|nr:hypothetical protein PAAG_11755 [Paracoccidioides lutzii Pb01]KGQ01518.1 hypothetical protein PAAG_11755 [Paracoccidioides lutzii Pb01]
MLVITIRDPDKEMYALRHSVSIYVNCLRIKIHGFEIFLSDLAVLNSHLPREDIRNIVVPNNTPLNPTIGKCIKYIGRASDLIIVAVTFEDEGKGEDDEDERADEYEDDNEGAVVPWGNVIVDETWAVLVVLVTIRKVLLPLLVSVADAEVEIGASVAFLSSSEVLVPLASNLTSFSLLTLYSSPFNTQTAPVAAFEDVAPIVFVSHMC